MKRIKWFAAHGEQSKSHSAILLHIKLILNDGRTRFKPDKGIVLK